MHPNGTWFALHFLLLALLKINGIELAELLVRAVALSKSASSLNQSMSPSDVML